MKENEAKTQQKPRSKGMNTFMKVLNTIINIMIVLVLIVSIFIAVMALTYKANGISTMFGYTIQPIQSDSMKGGSPDGYPEGDYVHGDLMIARATEFDNTAKYNKGDIITFVSRDKDNKEMLISHRIIDVAADENGTLTYQTQGDNRETSPVPDQQEKKDYIKAYEIASVYYTEGYVGKILKGWGAPLDYLRSQQGFFFVVLLPMIIFFLYELIRVVMNFSNYKKAKADEEKEEAVKAAVAAAKAEKELHDLPDSISDMTPEQLEQFKHFMAMQEAKKAEEKAAEQSTEQSETVAEPQEEIAVKEETDT